MNFKYLKVGFGQAWDFENIGLVWEETINELNERIMWNKKIAIKKATEKALSVGSHLNKCPEWYDGVLFFTIYRYYDISNFSSDWKGSTFARSFNFDSLDPFPSDNSEAKSFVITDSVPDGVEVLELDF